MPTFEMRRPIEAPPSVVWPVISDVEGYAEVAPNLTAAHVVEGAGVGMRRRCYDTRNRGWNEECLLWDEGRAYLMAVDTSDYPYPFRKMQGTWAVEDHPAGSLITMRFDYEWKSRVLGWFMERVYARRAFTRICGELMDNWENLIKQRMDTETAGTARRPNPRPSATARTRDLP